MTPNIATSSAVVAFELIALPGASAKQGLALRVLMDASAARLMIAGMTGASTGLGYSHGEVAHWMATILASDYPGDASDKEWASVGISSDREGFGSAFAIRGALATVEQTAAALREAATKLIARAGKFCLVEYGYCDTKGKGQKIADWTDRHADQVIGRVAASDTLSTAYLVFTDQRAALKTVKAEASHHNAPSTPAGIIAAAVALESQHDD